MIGALPEIIQLRQIVIDFFGDGNFACRTDHAADLGQLNRQRLDFFTDLFIEFHVMPPYLPRWPSRSCKNAVTGVW